MTREQINARLVVIADDDIECVYLQKDSGLFLKRKQRTLRPCSCGCGELTRNPKFAKQICATDYNVRTGKKSRGIKRTNKRKKENQYFINENHRLDNEL